MKNTPQPQAPVNPKTALLHTVAVSAVAAIAGILLIAAPATSGSVIVYIISGLLVLAGIAQIVLKKIRGRGILPFDDYASGISVFTFGIFLIFRPDVLAGILSVLISVLLIYAGFRILECAVRFFMAKTVRWWLPAVLAAPVLFSGFFGLAYPFEKDVAKCIFLGIALLAYAAIEIAFLVLQRKSDVVFPSESNRPAQQPAAAAPVQQPAAPAPVQQPAPAEEPAAPAADPEKAENPEAE